MSQGRIHSVLFQHLGMATFKQMHEKCTCSCLCNRHRGIEAMTMHNIPRSRGLLSKLRFRNFEEGCDMVAGSPARTWRCP